MLDILMEVRHNLLVPVSTEHNFKESQSMLDMRMRFIGLDGQCKMSYK